MKRIILFKANLLLSIIFGWDIMNYYFIGGINIISNDVNRVFIMWFGFVITTLSSCWFINKHVKK